MKKIRIAQIGIEHDHASCILKTLRSLPDIFEVVAYADPEKEIVYEPFTGKNTVGGYEYDGGFMGRDPQVYDDLPEMTVEELLEIPGLEAVAIETSETNLFKYARMAAEKGLHVHMDKPGGTEYRDFAELVDIFKRTGKTLHLGYMYRYNPEVQRTLREIGEGKYGEIYSVECQMSTRHPDEKRAWMGRYPGGMMFFLGCHLIDLIYRIQGEPEEVIPMNTVTGINGLETGEDFGFAILRYKNGVSFAKTCAAEPGGFLRRQFVVCGSKGTVEFKPFEAYSNVVGSSELLTKVRDVEGDILNWGNDGTRRESSFDRYIPMMTAFAGILRGERENPYSMDYELAMYKVLMRACGRPVE